MVGAGVGDKDPGVDYLLVAAVDIEAAAVWQWFCQALPPRPGWSTMVSVPMVSLARDTSVHADDARVLDVG